MLSSETKVVYYVNKKGERSTYPLSSAMESANLEMVKRLKYTKDILTHMLNANATTGKPGGISTPGGNIDLGSNTGQISQSSRPKTMNLDGVAGSSSSKFNPSGTGKAGGYQTASNFNPPNPMEDEI